MITFAYVHRDVISRCAEKFGVDAAQEELKLLEGELASVQELHFAFRRTASRLTEMAGEEYLLRWRTLRSGHEK